MKYLLCRPRGGLNDALNQIEKCWRYSEIHNRILIIDTEYLISTGISVKFSSLFEALDCSRNFVFELSQSLLDDLNKLNVFPPSCKGRLATYRAKLNEKLDHCDSEKNVSLTFNFNRNYEEDLILHDQFGGGAVGINCLARLRLTSRFRGDVLSYLVPLIGESHMAIHVRNTDYQTDYKSAFKNIYDQTINKRLLVCTDSVAVLNYAADFFDKSKTFSLSSPPATNGTGLSTYATYCGADQQRYELIVQAFADLIGMATAKKIFLCKISPGEFGAGNNQYSDFSNIFNTTNANQLVPTGINGFSGFSILAASLRNRPSLVKQLLTS
jgi:hypothetical protein